MVAFCSEVFDLMVAGTFHVPSVTQKPLVFEATAHGVCLLLFYGIPKNHNPSAKVCYGTLLSRIGCDLMVAGTFHVPSANQKPLVFEPTAHEVCLLLFYGIPKNHSLSAKMCYVALLSRSERRP
jgi:hypothetical protein